MLDYQSFLNYLNQSLGVEDVLLPVTVAEAPAPAIYYNPEARIAFFTEDQTVTTDERQLFEKIVQAMGLGLQQVALYTGASPELTVGPSQIRIHLVNEGPVGAWLDIAAARILRTHSLKNLIASPDLKKAAWFHLKQVAST